MTEGRPRAAHWLAGAAIAYAVAYHLGLLFIDPTTRTSTVWPASGVALAALLLTPKERRPPLYLTLAVTGAVSNLLAFGSLHTLRDAGAGLGALAANLLELFLAGWCLERVTARATFESVREVSALVCAAVVACMVGSALGSGSIALAHGVEFWATQRNFWVGDGLGMLMLAPLVVCWVRPGSSWRAPRWLEAALFLAVFLGVAWLTFRRESQWGGASPGAYVLIGLLAWPALRLGQRFVTLALALLALVAILSTRSGMWHSPWGGKTLHAQLLFLQTYLGFASGSALLFAASVAELRRAEQASRSAEERSRLAADRLATALDAASMGTWEWDMPTNATYWSPNIDAVMGQPPGGFERSFDAYMALVHPDDRALVEEAIQDVLTRGRGSYTSQHRIRTPDGSYRDMESKGRLDCDTSGKPFRLAGTLVDVTDRKRTAQAVVAGDLLLRQFIKYTPAAVAMFDTDMRYLQASDRWLSDYHLEGQELVGRSHYEVFPDIPERWKQVHQRVLQGAVEHNDDDPFPREGGGQEWLQWEVRPWHKPDGAIGGLIMFTQVVTERKQAELRNRQLQEQLREAQKLESLGTLAGGIAHDFNNILSAIVAYTQIAQLDNPNNAELQSQLGEVMKSSNRAAKLVQQILSFSRQQPHERRPTSLLPVYTDVLKLLRATLPATIELRERVDDNLPEVLGDPAQLHQVLMNLCTNASHAMKGRGVLRLELSRYTLAEGAVRPHLDLRAGHYLKLSISDDGQGMEAHVLSRIFEPFFTTKSSGEGTGLGLAVVHGIVKEHEGVITVESEPGRGTTFSIYLPALAAAELPLNEALINVPLGQGQHVLFVDDEAALCAAAKHILTRLGYTPHVFQDPQAAWRAFQAEPHTFHVLLTDLTMPGRTGLDLAGDVLRLRPNLPVILATGYSATLTPEALEERGIAELVFKPLDYQSLAVALAKVLPRPLERTA